MWIIGLIVIVVLGMYVMGAYNGLVKERNKVMTVNRQQPCPFSLS